jgi:hypothetical protein
MRMSRNCVALPFIVLTAFLGGCATYSVHPFYKPDEDTLEPGLVGMWAVEDTKITIQANKGGTYEAVFANSSSHGDCPYEVRLIRVGKNLFADAIFDDASPKGKDIDLPYGAAALHILLRLSLNRDVLSMARLNHDWLVNQLQAKKLTVAHEYMDENEDRSHSNILLTASSADLQKFIQQISDSPDAFEEPVIMQRQK